jgi:hypothetical protein
MLHRTLIALTIAGLSTLGHAQESVAHHISLSANVVPKLQNSDDSSVPGHEKIDDGAYMFALSYVNTPDDHDMGPFGKKVSYYSLRAFQFKHKYTDSADGVSSVKGVAAVYGQRYLLNKSGYQGFGLGWYAGVAKVKDTWVEKCCGPNPTEEDAVWPIGAAEVFYKYDVAKNVFVEPGVTLAWQSQGSGSISTQFQLMVGAQF